MKKTAIFCLLVIVILSSFAGCTQSSATPATTPVSEFTTDPTSSVAPTSPDVTVPPPAEEPSLDELRAQLKQDYTNKNYARALTTVEKILVLEPADDSMYAMKAELWILTLTEAYRALNNVFAEDLTKVSDPAAYRAQVIRQFNEAGLLLEIPFLPDSTVPEEINTIGNTAANLYGIIWVPSLSRVLYGVFARQGNWLYYAEPGDNYALYKMRLDGQDKQLVCADSACNINVMGDWIYFSNFSDDYAPYKVRTDGSMKMKLADNRTDFLCTAGDWVFFCAADSNGTVYKIRTDGTGRELVADGAKNITIQGDWLYLPSRDELSLTRLRLDGSEQQTLIEGRWNLLASLYDDWLYYLADNQGMAIMKKSLDGGEPVEVWKYDGKVYSFIVSGDRLIVSARSLENTEVLLAFDLITLEQVLRINDVGIESLCIDSDGNIYFNDAFKDRDWYTIDWETGAAVKLE
jgi:hypothetical protein